MKKICFVLLFTLILNGLFGQTSPKNRWLLGTWISNTNTIWVFNDNGSGSIGNLNFNFSIIQTANGPVLYTFYDDDYNSSYSYVLHRINDQFAILDSAEIRPRGNHIYLTKRN